MDMNTNNQNENSNFNPGYRSYQGYYQQPSGAAPVQPEPQKAPKKRGGVAKKVWLGIGIGFGALMLGILSTLYVIKLTQNMHLVVNGKTIIGDDSQTIRDNSLANSAAELIDQITGRESTKEEALEEGKAAEAESTGEAYEKIESTELTPSVAKTTVTDVTEVVKAVMPSVVAVNNKYTTQMNYFGQIYSQEGESAGSGIIVGQNATELLLVTNYHVVEGADELEVTFVDDEQATAQLKGSDADKDLAVIAINLADIPASTREVIRVGELGDSEALTVGEPVIAIGNSLGYGQSVTTGVVSALHRAIGTTSRGEAIDRNIPTFIQTDAAINPGNSGGALLNIYGQVIGINSNKIGGSAVEGMGYAIPISDAKPIIENLMSRETRERVPEANRGYLGITGVNVEEDTAAQMGLPKGVYVYSVSDESAADRAGLVRGDVIVGLDGEQIHSMEELKAALEYYSVGDTVILTVMQSSPTGYRSADITVKLQGAEG